MRLPLCSWSERHVGDKQKPLVPGVRTAIVQCHAGRTRAVVFRAAKKGSDLSLQFALLSMTLGIFWVGQQTQLNYLARSDRSLSWIHIAFLFVVSITPFSTALLAEFRRIALVSYWLNILLLGTALYFTWVCATRTGLLKDDMPPDVPAAIKRRIVIGQSLYEFGALLCIFNVLEHRVHRSRATQLPHRTTYSSGYPSIAEVRIRDQSRK